MNNKSLDPVYLALFQTRSSGHFKDDLIDLALSHPHPNFTAEIITLQQRFGVSISKAAEKALNALCERHTHSHDFCPFVTSLFVSSYRKSRQLTSAICTPECVKSHRLLHARAAMKFSPSLDENGFSKVLVSLHKCLKQNDLIGAPQLTSFLTSYAGTDETKVPAFYCFLGQVSTQMKCFERLTLSPQVLWEVTLVNENARSNGM